MVFDLYRCNDSPNSSPQQPPSYQTYHHFHTLHIGLIAMACFVTTVMLFLTFVIWLRRYNHDNDRDRRIMPILFDVHGYRDSTTNGRDDDDDGSVVDHPIWFIRTTGLQESVIDSIAVLKYRKNEGLVDGTDCSVCLGEFQEDESLRILPKCSHAFHILCIDTWLRSHQTCPLCRAPVINEAAAEVSVMVTGSEQVVPNVSGESRNQEGRIENFDNVVVEGIGLGEFQVVRIDNDYDSASVGVSSSERSYKNNTT
ncbi:unnamed protein product [Vicia faba]|uniref:RING-type E3 ubiquitin transferase n=1 Tax=Vicia faba TaxID=3906 RepID=A0AAV1BBB9_VICFA|nr:unnamed protein product [Vicia faba]